MNQLTINGGEINRLRLLTHARKYGIPRLRETCAIATVIVMHNTNGDILHPTAKMLEKISKDGQEITPQAIMVLKSLTSPGGGRFNHLVGNRLVDGYEAIQKRRRGDAKPPWA